MADEIQLTLSGTVTNGAFKDTISGETLKINQAAIGLHSPIVIVGTVEEDLAIGDITTLGWLYLKNLDAANYVTWGPKSGAVMVSLGRIRANEFAVLRLEPGITLRWLANVAPVKVLVKLYQD